MPASKLSLKSSLFITIAIPTLMVLVELIYPLLDPRIRQGE